ncbi:MAG: (Fe-S)-binding protein [Candidatus Hodarchaeota archaeon]
MTLDEVKEYVYICTRCNTCKYTTDTYLPSCPAGERFLFEPYFGSGKVWIARGIIEGNIKFSDSIVKKIFSCPVCGNCGEICDMMIGDHIVEIIEALRTAAVEAGYGPLPEHKGYSGYIDKEHNPYAEPHKNRLDWLDDKEKAELKEKAEVLYFVGCTSSYRQNKIARATYDLLKKIGIDFTISPEEWCCTSPLLRTGQINGVKEIANHNLDVIQKTGAKTIVTSCAGCYRTLKKDYEKLYGKKPDFDILHITEYLSKLLADKKIEVKPAEEKVTYHDPCHLGRHCGIYKPPRKLIKAIVGKKNLIEMPRNEKNAWCCGAGGGVKSAFKDWSVDIAIERIKEAEATGANILITSCPFCYRNLQDAIDKSGSKIKLYDITEYLLERL